MVSVIEIILKLKYNFSHPKKNQPMLFFCKMWLNIKKRRICPHLNSMQTNQVDKNSTFCQKYPLPNISSQKLYLCFILFLKVKRYKVTSISRSKKNSFSNR